MNTLVAPTAPSSTGIPRTLTPLQPSPGCLFRPITLLVAACTLLFALPAAAQPFIAIGPPGYAPSAPAEVRIANYARAYSRTTSQNLQWPGNSVDYEAREFDWTVWNSASGGFQYYGTRHKSSANPGPPNILDWTIYTYWPAPPSLGTLVQTISDTVPPFPTYSWQTTQTDVPLPVFQMVYVNTSTSTSIEPCPEPNCVMTGGITASENTQTLVDFFTGGYPVSTNSRMWALQFQGWDRTANNAVMDAAYLTNFAGVTIGGVAVDTNGIAYFRLADNTITNVTPILPAAFSNYYYNVVPTELETRIAFDADNDGRIELYANNDLTTSASPFVFWVNNDRDTWSDSDNDFVDSNPASFTDYEENRIHNERDLEDYNRVSIRIPSAVCRDTNWQCRILFAGKIKLFSTPGDDIRYVEDETYATLTFVHPWTTDGYGQYLGEVDIDHPMVLPRNFLESCGQYDSPNGSGGPEYARFNFLFKGGSAGTHRIKLELYYAGNRVGRSEAWLKLMDVEDMFDHYTVGDTTADGVAVPTTATRIRSSALPRTTSDYFLLVHGWRMQPWERRSFAATAYKRLWWLGFRDQFGLFSWPTEYVSTWTPAMIADNQNYNNSERQAWRSGEALRRLLHDLKSDPINSRVMLVAHSMGNIVAGEALRQLTDLGELNTVHRYVACQGAVPSHAYDSSAETIALEYPDPVFGVPVWMDSGTANCYGSFWPLSTIPISYASYFDGGNGAGSYINWHNYQDYALEKWKLNQCLKPALG